MSTTIPNLWPESIRTTVESPYPILRTQAEALGTMTNGVLSGLVEVSVTGSSHGGNEAETQVVRIDLVISALALQYKHHILTAQHRRSLPYPVTVYAECYRGGGSLRDPRLGDMRRPVNPEGLEEVVGEVLKSAEVESVLVSLIARSNDPLAEATFMRLENGQKDDSSPQ